MELLAPAGNIEKLKYAYLFGADAAYIGIKQFSLRARADNFNNDEYERIPLVKPAGKKLYCVLNIYYHDADIRRLEESLDYIALYPFDAFIISDIGILNLLQKRFPDTEVHLSTQANCINTEAAKLYRDMGFSRLIPARELSLKEIEQIKINVGIEIEVFVHGAMCLAYSGRCYLSSYMADRPANKGDCSHSCRWRYKLYYEEEERPGQYFPVFEGDNYNLILSSKDVNMIDHLKDLKNAGVDSLKIEGRMKSAYYTAIITRAYRKALDSLEIPVEGLEEYKAEIYKVSHREFSTGFFYGKEDIEMPTRTSYRREYQFLGFIGEPLEEEGLYKLIVKNRIITGDLLEYVGYDTLYIHDSGFVLYDANMNEVEKVNNSKEYFIRTGSPVKEGYIIRKKFSY